MKKLIVILFMVAVGFISCNLRAQDGKMPITTKSQEALNLYKGALTDFEEIKVSVGLDRLMNAIKIDPDFFMANFYLSLYYFGTKDKSTEYANAAINCKAKLSKAEELLRSTLPKIIADPKADVTDVGKQLVDMYPKDVWAYWFLFSFQNIKQDTNGSFETLKKALDVTSNPAPVYNMLGYRYMEIGNNDEAAKAFDKYIELAPNNPNVYDSKGDYFMYVKDYSKAYDSYMKAYALDTAWSYKKALHAKHLSDSLRLK